MCVLRHQTLRPRHHYCTKTPTAPTPPGIAVTPLVKIDHPPELALAVLDVLSRFLKHHVMPSWLHGSIPDEATWSDQEVAAWHMTRDVWGVPGALGWGRGTRWGSANNLIKISKKVQGTLSSFRFPFIVLHDPEDQVTQYAGSKKLVEQAQSQVKKLVDIVGGRHDLLCNQFEHMASRTIAFIEDHIDASTSATADADIDGDSGN